MSKKVKYKIFEIGILGNVYVKPKLYLFISDVGYFDFITQIARFV